jgi:hypothetical protein
LVLKYGQNGTGTVAELQLGGKRMGNKIVLGPFLVLLEGIIKDELKANCGSSGKIVGHRNNSKAVICVMER